MKAFLLFPARDFDPQQILSRRERELHYRAADPNLDLARVLPWNEMALIQDLGLDILFAVMSRGDKFLSEVAKVALLSGTSGPDIILYRQAILADCIRNETVVREMYEIAISTIAKERKDHLSYFSRYPSGIVHRSVSVLELFVTMLKMLRSLADRHSHEFSSKGFSRLFEMIRDELDDEYFESINAHLRRLKFRSGILISAQLGKGNKGTNYVLRKPRSDGRSWVVRLFEKGSPSFSFQLHPRDDAGARALSELSDRGLNLVGNALAQSVDHILSFFQMLRTELAFYIGCLNLRNRLTELGEPTCMPNPSPESKEVITFTGLYDVSLALNADRAVIGNDLVAFDKRLFIITGANTGGKSTFLRSVGLAYLMMQAGMFVAANDFASQPCNGLFTHYKREEDETMESGKLDEELGRMSEMIDHLKSNAIVLFNESFASTNEREGSEIASQIVRALLEKEMKIFFVTHLHHFASSFEQSPENTIFLRAERREDGSRPFKLIEAPPLQTSYGDDLYNRIFMNPAGEAPPVTGVTA